MLARSEMPSNPFLKVYWTFCALFNNFCKNRGLFLFTLYYAFTKIRSFKANAISANFGLYHELRSAAARCRITFTGGRTPPTLCNVNVTNV